MNARMTAIVACLALVGGSALAQQATGHKPGAQTVQRPAPKRADRSQPKAAEKHPAGKEAAATAKAYAAMPADKRLAIQADLGWTGYYQGPGGGNFDDPRVIEAVKLFQKANKGQETGIITEEERAHLAAAAEPHRQAVGWRIIDDPATGARFGIPEKLVAPLSASSIGSRWSSGHGQIQIDAFSMTDASLPALFENNKRTPRGRYVQSSALTPDSFVMSGTQGLKYFVARAQSSGDRVRGITILYDQATTGTMAPVALAIANSFQGFPDPNAALPPGQERAVEYGTATAVDDSGDLVTTRQVTADCNAIMIPGFGHAVRVAEDDTDDLALIRLYGAHNLAPAPLAGDSLDDDLTIVGIADPAAQQGGDAVTRAAVHRDGQNLAPVPEPGLSGAAAVDAQGRFAGIVALKSAIDPGSGSITRGATLVPVAAIRAFLQARGIGLTPVGGKIHQSIVRVICVRK